jgi:hypothetical protein
MMYSWAVLPSCKGISSATHGWLYVMNLGAMQIFAALRQQIRNRVSQEALGMVEATIDAVNHGQYVALKYLFEAVVFSLLTFKTKRNNRMFWLQLSGARWDCLKFLFRTTPLRKIPRKVKVRHSQTIP